MNPLLPYLEVEDAGHLRFGLPAGARIGHRQRRRDAERREEDVALFRLQPSVEIDGELVVRLHDSPRCLFHAWYRLLGTDRSHYGEGEKDQDHLHLHLCNLPLTRVEPRIRVRIPGRHPARSPCAYTS